MRDIKKLVSLFLFGKVVKNMPYIPPEIVKKAEEMVENERERQKELLLYKEKKG